MASSGRVDPEVARLSRELVALESEEQRRAKAPPGKVKCPECGAILEPTKNGRVRVHERSPWTPGRCEASGKGWKDLQVTKGTKGARPAHRGRGARTED